MGIFKRKNKDDFSNKHCKEHLTYSGRDEYETGFFIKTIFNVYIMKNGSLDIYKTYENNLFDEVKYSVLPGYFSTEIEHLIKENINLRDFYPEDYSISNKLDKIYSLMNRSQEPYKNVEQLNGYWSSKRLKYLNEEITVLDEFNYILKEL